MKSVCAGINDMEISYYIFPQIWSMSWGSRVALNCHIMVNIYSMCFCQYPRSSSPINHNAKLCIYFYQTNKLPSTMKENFLSFHGTHENMPITQKVSKFVQNKKWSAPLGSGVFSNVTDIFTPHCAIAILLVSVCASSKSYASSPDERKTNVFWANQPYNNRLGTEVS